MKQRLMLLSLLCLLAACDAKDECLDAGGSWNESQQICEKS